MSADILYRVTTAKVISILNQFQQISIKTISLKFTVYFISKIPAVAI